MIIYAILIFIAIIDIVGIALGIYGYGMAKGWWE